MIDHVNIPVTLLARSERFYEAALAALGYAVVGRDGPAVGFGTDSWMFGIEESEGHFPPLHVAFAAPSRDAVRAFHATALAIGGHCNGAPGLRDMYGPDYFAAYVLDPDGHNIEAVFRG